MDLETLGVEAKVNESFKPFQYVQVVSRIDPIRNGSKSTRLEPLEPFGTGWNE